MKRISTALVLAILIAGCQSTGSLAKWPGKKPSKQDAVASAESAASNEAGLPTPSRGPVSANQPGLPDTVAQHISLGQTEVAAWYQDFQDTHLSAAKMHFEEALRQDQVNADAHHGMAIVGDLQEDFQLAELHYQKALLALPNDGKILGNLGYSYLLQGRLNESEQFLQRALQADPSNQDATKHLGDVYAQNGQTSLARSTYSRVLNPQEIEQALQENAELAGQDIKQASNEEPSLLDRMMSRKEPENTNKDTTAELLALMEKERQAASAERGRKLRERQQQAAIVRHDPQRDAYEARVQNQLARIDQEGTRNTPNGALVINNAQGTAQYQQQQPYQQQSPQQFAPYPAQQANLAGAGNPNQGRVDQNGMAQNAMTQNYRTGQQGMYQQPPRQQEQNFQTNPFNNPQQMQVQHPVSPSNNAGIQQHQPGMNPHGNPQQNQHAIHSQQGHPHQQGHPAGYAPANQPMHVGNPNLGPQNGYNNRPRNGQSTAAGQRPQMSANSPYFVDQPAPVENNAMPIISPASRPQSRSNSGESEPSSSPAENAEPSAPVPTEPSANGVAHQDATASAVRPWRGLQQASGQQPGGHPNGGPVEQVAHQELRAPGPRNIPLTPGTLQLINQPAQNQPLHGQPSQGQPLQPLPHRAMSPQPGPASPQGNAFQEATQKAARMGMGLGPGTMFPVFDANSTTSRTSPGSGTNWNGNSFTQPQRQLPTDLPPQDLSRAYHSGTPQQYSTPSNSHQQQMPSSTPQMFSQEQFGTASRYNQQPQVNAPSMPNAEFSSSQLHRFDQQRQRVDQQLTNTVQQAWGQRPMNDGTTTTVNQNGMVNGVQGGPMTTRSNNNFNPPQWPHSTQPVSNAPQAVNTSTNSSGNRVQNNYGPGVVVPQPYHSRPALHGNITPGMSGAPQVSTPSIQQPQLHGGSESFQSGNNAMMPQISPGR